MSKQFPAILLWLLVAVAAGAVDWPGGAAPPDRPVLFAPGLVNVGAPVRDVAIAPDGATFFFGIQAGEHVISSIAEMHRQLGGPARMVGNGFTGRFGNLFLCPTART